MSKMNEDYINQLKEAGLTIEDINLLIELKIRQCEQMYKRI